MNDALLLQVPECLQDLNGEPSHQAQTIASEVILLDELIQVDGEKFKRYEQMLPEIAGVLDPDDVHLIVGVVVSQVSHDVQLNLRLVLELLLVSNDLDRHQFACLVISAFQGLAERSFTQEVKHFEPERKVVTQDDLIVTLIIVISVVEPLPWLSVDFFGCVYGTQIVDGLII